MPPAKPPAPAATPAPLSDDEAHWINVAAKQVFGKGAVVRSYGVLPDRIDLHVECATTVEASDYDLLALLMTKIDRPITVSISRPGSPIRGNAKLAYRQGVVVSPPFADVDEVIDAWATANVKKLFDEWAGHPARFAYLPGLRPFECFQISIDPPRSGHVAVIARSIDTDDGAEFERTFEGPTDALSTLLQEATDTVTTWSNRTPANGS